jgi:hypothetical protein
VPSGSELVVRLNGAGATALLENVATTADQVVLPESEKLPA